MGRDNRRRGWRRLSRIRHDVVSRGGDGGGIPLPGNLADMWRIVRCRHPKSKNDLSLYTRVIDSDGINAVYAELPEKSPTRT